RGVIYAPTSELSLTSSRAVNVGGIVAKKVTISGPGTVRLGLPLPVVTVEPEVIPIGEVGVAYRATTLVAEEGSAPYTWTAAGLPAGLTIAPDTGVISGTPTAAGTFADVVVTVVDATAQASSFDYTVDINPAMAVTFAALGNGEIGVAYPPMPPAATGGTLPYTWTATALPVGLSIDAATGTISGTPTTAGPFPLSVTVTGGLTATATTTYAVNVAPALAPTWLPALPVGQVGVAYAPTVMTAAAGATPYAWSATGLPAGLTIDAASGTVAGTPTAAGTATVVVSVVDALGATLIKSYTATVNPPLNAAWPTIPQGQVGEDYTTTMLASGGTPPYVWSATGLPPGLTLGAANGTVSGVPGDDGTYAVTIRVTDGARATLSASYSMVIVPAPVVCPGVVAGWRGVYYPNVSLAGEPGQCRDDPSVDFDWGTGAAGPDLPEDGFSVHWTRKQAFAAGTYTFSMGSDDGSRLYIDGVLVLDRWVDGLYPAPVPTVVVDLTEGNHTIDMEYYDATGSARATLTWVRSTSASCTGTAAGWFAQYYSNATLTGLPAACRDEAEINADWVGGAPLAGMPTDNFSVRWTRTQTFAAGAYNFALGTDDGGRVYLDGVLILDRWSDQLYPSPPPNVTRAVSAGPHVVVVEYYDHTGSARASLATTYVAPPTTPSLAFSNLTNTYWSGTGTTVYYRSSVAGSFTTTASSTDPAWGIASYAFPALGTKWTSTPGTIGVNTYTSAVSPTAPGTKNITSTNTTGVVSAASPFTVISDTTAPAGTLSYTNSATAAATINVTLTASDTASGIASRLLQVQSAPLVGSTCGTYGTFETLVNGTNPVSPVVTPITLGQCYKYRYLVTDNVGNLRTATTTSVVKARKTYANTVIGTPGLISYWRLGDAAPFSADTFTAAAGAALQTRIGERGATWTKLGGDATDAVLTNANRLRKGGTDTIGAVYYSSGVPSTTYTVYADIFVASSVPGDVAGVVGRVDVAAPAGTYYLATYEQSSQTWVLSRRLAGVQTVLARTGAQPLTVGATYRISLYMSSTTIKLLVNGVQQLSFVDSGSSRISATGKAGFVLGNGATATTTSDATGMQLDSFTGSTSQPTLLDTKAANTGAYLNGPILGATTALIGDTNGAIQLDGVNDYGNVARQISADFSIELWFKSTVGGIGAGPQWWQGAGLVDASVTGTSNDFGIALRADGKVVAGVGNPDVSITSPAAYQDGLWHHVVFTRSMASGELRLYVDGGLAAAGTGNTAALVDPPAINFGRIQSATNGFNGFLDEISMYNTVLTSETVTAHFYAGK
ncbi:MAG: putative Ig domain-containing protein, partial [Ilumatobacteraceae bacterium]